MEFSSLKLANGLMTRVRDWRGDKPPLLLIHGLANSIEIWDRVAPALARSFRVIAFDLPGFGDASRPHAAYDSAFFVEQLCSVMNALNLEKAHLVGSSLGASLIVRFSAHNLHRIDSAVLAAPGGFGRETHLAMRIPALPLVGNWLGRPTRMNNALTLKIAIHDHRHITRELTALTNRYAAMPGSEQSFVRALNTGVGLTGVKERHSFEALARRLDCPTLVLWGQQDKVFPVRHSERAMALLPDARLQLFNPCGHYPHWEQPDAFVSAVERFLA